MLRARRLLGALIVAATVTFVVGAIVERSASDNGNRSQRSEAAETGGETTGSEEAVHRADAKRSEEILGFDPESAPLVVVAVIVSLALAAGVVRWPRFATVLWLAAIAMAAFAALDLREVFHQLNESRNGLAVLAGVVAGLHALAACVSALQARRTPAS